MSTPATEASAESLAADHAVTQNRRARHIALTMVVLAAVLWSTSGLVFRLLEEPNPWRIVFWRSGLLVPFMVALIVLRTDLSVASAVRAGGWHAPLAGMFLGATFVLWIMALGATTVANAVFLLCCSPIASALLARLVLGERMNSTTGIAIAGVVIGVGIINAGELNGELMDTRRLFGNLCAIATALGFAAYAVTVRARRNADMQSAVFFGALFAAIASFLMAGGDVPIGLRDFWLCLVLGVGQVGIGLVLFTAGARHLPVVELTLLSLIEVVLAPFWVWAFLGEAPRALTLAGGAVMLAAVAGPAFILLRRGGLPP